MINTLLRLVHFNSPLPISLIVVLPLNWLEWIPLTTTFPYVCVCVRECSFWSFAWQGQFISKHILFFLLPSSFSSFVFLLLDIINKSWHFFYAHYSLLPHWVPLIHSLTHPSSLLTSVFEFLPYFIEYFPMSMLLLFPPVFYFRFNIVVVDINNGCRGGQRMRACESVFCAGGRERMWVVFHTNFSLIILTFWYVSGMRQLIQLYIFNIESTLVLLRQTWYRWKLGNFCKVFPCREYRLFDIRVSSVIANALSKPH